MEIILCIFKTFLLCAEKIFGLLTGKYTFPDMLEWIGGSFDPEEFNIDKVNQILKMVR